MWGREEEIGVSRQIGWHRDRAMQVILDQPWAPAQLWLFALVEGKAEVQRAAGSRDLEFPGQLLELRSLSTASKPSSWTLGKTSRSLDLHQLEAWLWAVPD